MNKEPIEVYAEVVGEPKQLPQPKVTGTLMISMQHARIRELEKQIDNLVLSTRKKLQEKYDEIELCKHRIKKYTEADQPPPTKKRKLPI